MKWSLQEGLSKGRAPTPDQLARPPLTAGEEWMLSAFWDLSSNREQGWGVLGQIPHRDIVAYAKEAGMSPTMTAAFNHVIRRLDSEYLNHAREKAERERKQREHKGGRPRGGL